MLRFCALNNDVLDVGEPEVAVEVKQEEEESKTLAQYNKALTEQRSGHLTEAKQLYNNILQSEFLLQCPDPAEFEPQDVKGHSGLLLKYNVYKNLGGIAFGGEEFDNALDLYLEAALIDESDVSLWWKIGEAALKVTNVRLARYAFEKGLNCSPKHWPCLQNLVTVLYVIGDYTACLKLIADELSRNNAFIKATGFFLCLYDEGLAIRDQIFKEEPHLKKDFYSYKSLFLAKSKTDTHEEEYQKYIEEALFMREKRRLLSRREELPKVKFSKPFNYFSWSCLGDCLLHLYEEVTDPDQNKSLCWPVDLEKYRRTADQQETLSLPSPEIASKKTVKGTHKDGEEKRGVKRKKVSPGGADASGEPIPKRRSARVKPSKPKEEDINWTETLLAYLPEFIRSDATAETEDSQDSMTEDQEAVKLCVPEDSHAQLVKEAKKVSNFINLTTRNSGCLDLMDKFLKVLVSDCNGSWPQNLSGIYAKIYNKIRKQIWFPSPPAFCKDASNEYYAEFAQVVLIALECQLDQWLLTRSKASLSLSPGQKGTRVTNEANNGGAVVVEGAKEFTEDSHYLLLCTCAKDIFQDFWAEFNVRFFWLQARFHMLQGDNDKAINYFERGISALTPGNGFVENSSLTIKLCHCLMDNVINFDNVQKKLEELERCQSLEEVNKLYETGSYRDVVDLLTPLLRQTKPIHKADDVNVSSPERPSQLLLLQESLYKLKEYKKCLLCSEVALNEAVQLLTPCEAWTSTLERLFKCLNRVLKDHSDSLELLAKENTRRLIQNLIKVIEHSMEASDSNESQVATVMPWLILYRIVKYYDQSNLTPFNDTSQKDGENSCSQDTSYSMPPYVRFLQASHDHLGRRSLCCDNKGILVLQFVRDIHHDLQRPFPPAIRKELSKELEQCLFCLYGHPSKKTKNKWLQDHNSEQVSLTWEYANIVYDFFKPPGLPELESKLHTISVEVQNVLRRLVAVVPQREVEVISFEDLQSYIDGVKEMQSTSELEATSKRVIVKDLFYYLGDFYFKNKEFSKAVKFYMHDVCLNPDRFESWAAMALARGSRLEEKIRACEPKSDGPVKKHIISTLRCFERAVDINNRNCMILEEYGSTAYMLNSHASRRLREQWQDEEFTPDTQATFLSRKTEMLELAEACFTKANECLRNTEGEPWLHSYMLGKAAEKLGKEPNIFLDYYQKAGRDLHKAKASYPKRIPYHGAPEYSIEVLELYYRVHSSVLNIIEKSEGDVDLEKLEGYVERASQAPFVLAGRLKDTKTSTPTRSAHASPVKRQSSVDKHNQNTNVKAQTSPSPTKSEPSSCAKALTFATPMTSSDDVASESCGLAPSQDPLSSQDESTLGDNVSQTTLEEPLSIGKDSSYQATKITCSSDNESSQASMGVGGAANLPNTGTTGESVLSSFDKSPQIVVDTSDKMDVTDDPQPESEDGLNWYKDMQLSTCSDVVKDSEVPSSSVLDVDDQNVSSTDRMDVDDIDVTNKNQAQVIASSSTGILQSTSAETSETESEYCAVSTKATTIHETSGAKPQDEPTGKDNNEAFLDSKQSPIHEKLPEKNQQSPNREYKDSCRVKTGENHEDATPTDRNAKDLLDDIDSNEKKQDDVITNVGGSSIGEKNEVSTKSPGQIPNITNDFKRVEIDLESKFASNIDQCKRIIDRCLKAFSYCLKRFPEHYKSQYKMAYIFAYYSTHKDLQWCRDLLLGGTTLRTIPLPVHGLFSDRKRTNLFQYLWRIPIDEIDRPGSFCSHICRAVELLLDVLSQLKEWDTLLLVSSFLHRTPDKDKKYLRDNDRAFLAIKAFDLSVLILKSRIRKMEAGNEENQRLKKQLVMDCYEAYRHAQRMQTSTTTTEHLLVRGYQVLLGKDKRSSDSGEGSRVTPEQAIKYCFHQYESLKKIGQSSSGPSQNPSGLTMTSETKTVKGDTGPSSPFRMASKEANVIRLSTHRQEQTGSGSSEKPDSSGPTGSYCKIGSTDEGKFSASELSGEGLTSDEDRDSRNQSKKKSLDYVDSVAYSSSANEQEEPSVNPKLTANYSELKAADP